MKKLVRTVPMPKGDDSAVHDDMMDFDIPIIEEKESHHYKYYVRGGDYKQKIQNNDGACKGLKEKIDKVILFKATNKV